MKQKLCAQAQQKKEFIHYFPFPARCPVTSWEAGSHHAGQFLRKMNAITMNMFPSSSFGQFGSAVTALSLPYFLSTPSLLLVGVDLEKEKASTLCARTVQPEPKHWCLISTVLSTNPKHSTIQATKKKVHSTPPRPPTVIQIEHALLI